ncbi:hypothetical protein G6F56_007143 [Rhizopus delemar]|nr:hypothetical protein G6F56_007143 [Rhizopus delemar]
MTSTSTSEVDNSWLKKRSTVFGATTTATATSVIPPPNTKVVDKELARLKTMGAVSSVWSNKFVQEDTGGTDSSPTPGRLNMSPRPNANYIPTGNRTSLKTTRRSSSTSQSRMTDSSRSSLELENPKRSSTSSTEQVLKQPSSSSTTTTSTTKQTPTDESLWSQYESLKAQYAQVNSRLEQANKDIAYYKQQHEIESESKEQEVSRVRELAQLIVKQHELLGEYEISLEKLRVASSKDQQGELASLRQELGELYQIKNEMEKTIGSLKADLEMSYSQMRLMMVVSTEIQSEFESYKQKMNAEINELLAEKEQEGVIEYGIATSSYEEKELEALRLEINKLNAAILERDRQSQAALLEHQEALAKIQEQALELQQFRSESKSSYRNSGGENTVKFLQGQIQELNKTLEQKDQLIGRLENQIKTQKMNMDSQMIDLTQSILEKDALLLEFMSSRNNSMDSSILCASPTMAEMKKDDNDATGVYYQRENEARRQMSQVRDFMYTTSSEEEEEEQGEDDEAAYSTDEENHSITKTSRNERGPQSPGGTISSYISFDSSDDEQEQVAEIKHFSYTSVLSQSTLSLHSQNGTAVNTQEPKRNSHGAPSPFGKDATGSWPMPPPTPPPSEPLPPLPMFREEGKNSPPPPRRGRSKTMVREEAAPSVYTTSIHKTTELPRIVPLQKEFVENTLPVPPLRKDIKKIIESPNPTQHNHPLPANTTWMDDPESEEEEHWSEALSQ